MISIGKFKKQSSIFTVTAEKKKKEFYLQTWKKETNSQLIYLLELSVILILS